MQPKKDESAEVFDEEVKELTYDELLESALINLEQFINDNYYNYDPSGVFEELEELESDDLLEDSGLLGPET